MIELSPKIKMLIKSHLTFMLPLSGTVITAVEPGLIVVSISLLPTELAVVVTVTGAAAALVEGVVSNETSILA